jgi:hypothetical protein
MAVNPRSLLTAPGTALLVSGILNALVALMSLAGNIFRFFDGVDEMPVNQAESIGFVIGTGISVGATIFTLFASPFVIFGAVQMLNGKRYGWARLAAWLSVVPFTACCLIVGIPAGIWALIVLARPEIKAFFSGEYDDRMMPPAPPSFR